MDTVLFIGLKGRKGGDEGEKLDLQENFKRLVDAKVNRCESLKREERGRIKG